MTPDPHDPDEAEGVLNPASGRGPDGELYLLPRLVARGNVSRVGLARVVVADREPVGVERRGVVLAPSTRWESGAQNAGVEDPRTTWVPDLGLHVMTYVAYGPLGPRTAVATSRDLRTWHRLGPLLFRHDPDLDVDLNLYPNKDVVLVPEVVRGPGGRPCFAVLHRPTWDLGLVRRGEREWPPSTTDDPRPSIWIAYADAAAVLADPSALTLLHGARPLAGPEQPWEALKIGAGPAPLRVPEGWLLLHHGVTGHIEDPWSADNDVRYCAGAMLLDADDPSRVVARTEQPLLEPETDDERHGTVADVVFPTAAERIGDDTYVFYGMADARIGVARLDRVPGAA
ncbi:glycosidase [Cellulomonas triticagri]|uniref:Glycosidase n=2 Tax=Cellulomonas triticagri TaxID=2483352 RepID=A0A3M2IV55_9CELL|nr:glycosidase [Cellulomonas triticagri]RMI03751.1 glycosidase [Cellulomonas triticagri]